MAECPNGLSAIEAAVQATPDVCLLEVHMPGVSGIEATLRIGQQLPIAGVVVMTASPNELGLAEAIRAGAHGYVDKWLETPRLAGTLRVVFSGQTAFPRALVRRALGHELAH